MEMFLEVELCLRMSSFTTMHEVGNYSWEPATTWERAQTVTKRKVKEFRRTLTV